MHTDDKGVMPNSSVDNASSSQDNVREYGNSHADTDAYTKMDEPSILTNASTNRIPIDDSVDDIKATTAEIRSSVAGECAEAHTLSSEFSRAYVDKCSRDDADKLAVINLALGCAVDSHELSALKNVNAMTSGRETMLRLGAELAVLALAVTFNETKRRV